MHPSGASSFVRLGALMDDAEADVLAYMGFPAQHRTSLHCSNISTARSSAAARVVRIFSNEDVVMHLIGALLLEQNDEWAV